MEISGKLSKQSFSTGSGRITLKNCLKDYFHLLLADFYCTLFTIMSGLWSPFDMKAESKCKFLREDDVRFSGKYIKFSVCKIKIKRTCYGIRFNVYMKISLLPIRIEPTTPVTFSFVSGHGLI